MVWAAENVDNWQGWSLTGYSWGGLTEQYNPWRVKVGLIGSEFDISRKHAIDAGEDTVYEPWEEQVNQDPVFGVSFMVEF
jgi:hypothetical protein